MSQKLKYPKISPLLLVIAVFVLAIIVLSGWGLKVNRSSIKSFMAYTAAQSRAAASQSSSPPDQKTEQLSPTPKNSSGSTASSSPLSTSSQPSSSHPPTATISAADKQKATEQIEAIDSQLEVYETANGYYPSNINASNFTQTCSDGCNILTPPAGIYFVYSPTPAGCTTAAQDCMHWTLKAVDSSGNLVAPEQQSFN